MNFSEKIAAIEEARKLHPEFDKEFTDYLGLGHSFNGAYNHFTIEDINKYNKPAPVKTQPAPTVVQNTKTTKTETQVKPETQAKN